MKPISESDLHAYVDGQLDPLRRVEVEAYLASNPAEAERIAGYRRQNEALHAAFDPVLAEPVPARMRRPERPRYTLLRYAAVAGWMILGGVIGWTLHGSDDGESVAATTTLARQAAVAHVVYAPELRHPVEVGADQEAHLAAWLSKRLGTNVKPPDLNSLGYGLVGGRLLPGERGPAAQFMYQDVRGRRLTLYVRSDAAENHDTAFRFAQEAGVSVFYWMDGPLGYALSGELEQTELLKLASAVYRQLNP